MTSALPRILFFNINGSGTGHLSRCLAYARRMQGRAKPVFFSLASALEIIQDMGFEADYFVSPFWSRSHINAWNRELAVRLGLILEEVRPAVAVFDGTWPFHGFMHACDVYGVPLRVWSNRGLHKEDFETVPVEESAFDLVIQPGEIGAEFVVERAERPGRKVTTPPVTVLRDDELLDRGEARDALRLPRDGRYALFSLGPGNLKDVSEVARGLIEEVQSHGFAAVWTRAPISVRDVSLPRDVQAISVYPLSRYLRAFDVFVGAAGYNACCELIQAGIPGLLVPNTMLADDQVRRAEMVARQAPVVVSACETAGERQEAVASLLELVSERERETGVVEARPTGDGGSGIGPNAMRASAGSCRGSTLVLDGAERAADEILALLTREVPA